MRRDRDARLGSGRNCHLPVACPATMAEQEGAGQRWVTAWHGASRVICPQQNSYFLNFLYSLISLALCSCERDCEKKNPCLGFYFPKKMLLSWVRNGTPQFRAPCPRLSQTRCCSLPPSHCLLPAQGMELRTGGTKRWVEIKTIYWKQHFCEDLSTPQHHTQPWGRGTISS